MMNEHLNVAWEVIGDDLVVEMMGAIGKLRLECIKIVAIKYQRSLLKFLENTSLGLLRDDKQPSQYDLHTELDMLQTIFNGIYWIKPYLWIMIKTFHVPEPQAWTIRLYCHLSSGL